MRTFLPALLAGSICAAGLLGGSGCITRDITAENPTPSRQQNLDQPISSNRDVDILFVVDNSDSMADKQDTLLANFPLFIQVLQNIPGGLPNVHIGVTSSDVGIEPFEIDGPGGCHGNGDNGLLQNTPRGGCLPPTGGARYIEDIGLPDGTRQQNYTGALEDVFTCIARLGTNGCGFEGHLEGMKRALDGTNPENAGFLRDDAYLAIVIMGDEDDCSARDTTVFNPDQSAMTISELGPFASYRCTEFGVTCDGLSVLPRTAGDYQSCAPRGDSYLWHPDHYVDFIKSLKADPSQIVVAVIGGNPTPFGVFLDPSNDGAPTLKHSCMATIDGNLNVADPGVRFRSFVEGFTPQSQFVSICQPDFSQAMTDIAKLVSVAFLGSPCLDGDTVDLTDLDPSEPGLQIDCSVSDVQEEGTPAQTAQVIPRCTMTDPMTPDPNQATYPCWWIEINATTCPANQSPENVELHVERNNIAARRTDHISSPLASAIRISPWPKTTCRFPSPKRSMRSWPSSCATSPRTPCFRAVPYGDEKCDNCLYYMSPDQKLSYCWHPKLRILVGGEWWCQWWEKQE